MDSGIELDTSFRFLALTERQAEALQLSGMDCEFGRHHRTNAITGVVPLNGTVISKLENFVNQQSIEISSTDIFVSFTTEYDSRIIDIPCHVNEIIKKLGSRLVVSYTVL